MLQDATKVFKAGNPLSVRLTKDALKNFYVEDWLKVHSTKEK